MNARETSFILALTNRSLARFDILKARLPEATQETQDQVIYWRKQTHPDNWLIKAIDRICLLHKNGFLVKRKKLEIFHKWCEAEDEELGMYFYANLIEATADLFPYHERPYMEEKYHYDNLLEAVEKTQGWYLK
jgi:hypothetical protein